MGASFVSAVKEPCSVPELRSFVDSLCSESRYRDGYEYSGSWGMKHGVAISKEVFSCRDEAAEYIANKNGKWDDNALAVRVIQAAPSARIKSLQKKLENARYKERKARTEAQELSHSLSDKALERANSAKSEYRSCKCCGSKVRLSYVRRVFCPVCNSDDFLLTQTDKSRITKANQKANARMEEDRALQEELEVESKKKISDQKLTDDNWYWLVGAWCAS